MSVTLDKLVSEGFNYLTSWRLSEGKIRATGPIRTKSNLVYAFVVDQEVKYIGLTSRIMSSRLDDYRDQKHEQTTRIRELIKGEINARKTVAVYVIHVPDLDRLEIEEDRLIEAFCPPWNRRRYLL